MGMVEMSVVMRNLMVERLGYQKFVIQGGDWGSAIGSSLATLFPENVAGFHTNLCFSRSTLATLKLFIASLYPSAFMDKRYVEYVFPVKPKLKFLLTETGYMHLQATKPDTIGVALSNNPIGLAAYILEKFSTWTNPEYRSLPDGGLTKYFTMDELLDNVMIYYLSNAILTSQRLYAESSDSHTTAYNMDRVKTGVPVGYARFRHEMVHCMDWALRDKFSNLIHSTYHPDGGHFAAMQLPGVLLKDFVEFVNKI